MAVYDEEVKTVADVHYINHPLIKHKITMLRKESTGNMEFRKLVSEISMLMAYEALSDLPTRDEEIRTPIEETVQPVLDGKKPAVIPILRAGLCLMQRSDISVCSVMKRLTSPMHITVSFRRL